MLKMNNGNNIRYINNWKDTYIINKRNIINEDEKIKYYHQPIKVHGIFSNLLYRSWACHSCDLNSACPGIFTHNDIPKYHYDQLSLEDFIYNYEGKNTHVIITNAVTDWKAFEKWDEKYLISKFGNNKLRATSATAPLSALFTIEEYFGISLCVSIPGQALFKSQV